MVKKVSTLQFVACCEKVWPPLVYNIVTYPGSRGAGLWGPLASLNYSQ